MFMIAAFMALASAIMLWAAGVALWRGSRREALLMLIPAVMAFAIAAAAIHDLATPEDPMARIRRP